MTAHQSFWAPETLRALKEILYRFMGEVHATKAALYFKTPDDVWTLATQYGFGRRDPLNRTFADDDTIVRMVRAFGENPRYYNDPSELSEIEAYLAQAGSARLMLVPLTGADGLIGFVDVRDKGGQRLFAGDDLDLARTIASALAQRLKGDDDVQPTAAVETAVAAGSVSTPVEDTEEKSEEPEALLDEPGLDEVNDAATDGLVDPRVMAVALTIASQQSGATLVHQTRGTSLVELEPLIRHQIDAMTGASVPVPSRAAWKTEVRRVPGDVVVGRQPVIATSLVMEGAGCSMTASVVAEADPPVARQALEKIGVRVRAARDRFRLRIARRGLARRLLQPGDRRYPELVAHSLGVSRLCWSIARVLGLDQATIEKAALAGLLHDVGMRELDYDRLYMHPTPGPEDRRTYRLHVEVGDRIVRVEGFGEIADAVRHHHERWDGNGYPDRLAGDAIPLLARIVHVAEVFDLFTAANSYRPAVSRERALAILDRAAGHQFDPTTVEAITKVIA